MPRGMVIRETTRTGREGIGQNRREVEAGAGVTRAMHGGVGCAAGMKQHTRAVRRTVPQA